MSPAAIIISDLGKRYFLESQPRDKTLRDTWGSFSPRVKTTRQEFWALEKVNIQIKAGEIVGIIGKNGAGKSTLLKIISRIIAPTTGSVLLEGKISSLLEVGTGFHPDLTGRENIFLSGAILGMKQAEIKRKFAEIVEFSDLEKFLDTPVKYYSSGMYVRLGFAVAAHLDSEIVLLDEILSVGDLSFQERCLKRIDAMRHSGKTILMVSHNIDTIQEHCPRTILLSRGKVVADDQTSRVIASYKAYV